MDGIQPNTNPPDNGNSSDQIPPVGFPLDKILPDGNPLNRIQPDGNQPNGNPPCGNNFSKHIKKLYIHNIIQILNTV